MNLSSCIRKIAQNNGGLYSRGEGWPEMDLFLTKENERKFKI